MLGEGIWSGLAMGRDTPNEAVTFTQDHIMVLPLLPPPNLPKLLKGLKPSKRLLEFADFAANYIQNTEVKPRPKRFMWEPRNPVLSSLQCQLGTELDFWALTLTHEDVPDHLRLDHLRPKYEEGVRYTIGLIRSASWEQHVNDEYQDVLDRFEDGCVVLRLGHPPQVGDSCEYTVTEVEAVFDRCKDSQHGVVSLRHVYNVLLSRAKSFGTHLTHGRWMGYKKIGGRMTDHEIRQVLHDLTDGENEYELQARTGLQLEETKKILALVTSASDVTTLINACKALVDGQDEYGIMAYTGVTLSRAIEILNMLNQW